MFTVYNEKYIFMHELLRSRKNIDRKIKRSKGKKKTSLVTIKKPGEPSRHIEGS